MEENQEKVPTEIATQLKVAQHNQHNATSVLVADSVSVLAKTHQGGDNKPLDDSNEESTNRSPH